MAADQDPEVLSALVRLMMNKADLSELTDEQVIQAMREGRESKKTAEIWGADELRRRGWTVERIAKELGVHRAQPMRWAREHPSRKGGDVDA